MNQLREFGYAELLHYYRQTPQVHSASVLFGVDRNKHITEEEKAEFMAIMIHGDPSFRVAQRACFLIQPQLANYQQANPVGHDEVLRKCRVYGKIDTFNICYVA